MVRRNPQSECQAQGDASTCIVPAGAPDWITPELIEATIRVWQPYYAEVLSPEDAVTMILDVGRLFEVLSSG